MSNLDNQKINLQELQKLLANAASKSVGSNTPMTFADKLKAYFAKAVQVSMIAAQNGVYYVDALINFIVRPQDPDRNEIIQYARPPILFGTVVIMLFFGIGGLWTVLAPLDSASHAMGVVISSSEKQVVQYSGANAGIIKKIFVKQGDVVKVGAPIVEFDEVQAKSSYEATLNQYLNALALESRLISERDELPKIEFNEILFEHKTPEIEKLIRVQTNIFNSRRDIIEKSIVSLNKEIEQYKKKTEAAIERKKSLLKNLEVTVARLKSTKDLVVKGFASKSDAQKLEVAEADIRSQVASTDSEIATIEQEIAKAEIKIVNFRNQHAGEVLKELKETQIQRAELKERFIVAQDHMSRIILKSPINGVVNNINYHTIGGVVGAGQPVAEITAVNEKLIVDAKIPAVNIDSVQVGQKAKIKFLAYKSRTSPTFLGTVISISPDTIQDQQAYAAFAQHNKSMASRVGDQFYAAKIELDMDAFHKIANKRGLKLIPGMSADIQIVTGTRTLFRYLMDPITDQAFKAFKER